MDYLKEFTFVKETGIGLVKSFQQFVLCIFFKFHYTKSVDGLGFGYVVIDWSPTTYTYSI